MTNYDEVYIICHSGNTRSIPIDCALGRVILADTVKIMPALLTNEMIYRNKESSDEVVIRNMQQTEWGDISTFFFHFVDFYHLWYVKYH